MIRAAVASEITEETKDDARRYRPALEIREALRVARIEDNAPVDVLGFSLGALLSADALLPPEGRVDLRRDIRVADWITIGMPYAMVRVVHCDYFAGHVEPLVPIGRWVNIACLDDYLGTFFREGDDVRGFRQHCPDRLEQIDFSRDPDYAAFRRAHPGRDPPHSLLGSADDGRLERLPASAWRGRTGQPASLARRRAAGRGGAARSNARRGVQRPGAMMRGTLDT